MLDHVVRPVRVGKGLAQAVEIGRVHPLEPTGGRHQKPASKADKGYAFLCSVLTVKVLSGSSPMR
jgi:hypothetical protein